MRDCWHDCGRTVVTLEYEFFKDVAYHFANWNFYGELLRKMVFGCENGRNNPLLPIGIVTSLHAKVNTIAIVFEGEITAVGRTVDVREGGHR